MNSNNNKMLNITGLSASKYALHILRKTLKESVDPLWINITAKQTTGITNNNYFVISETNNNNINYKMNSVTDYNDILIKFNNILECMQTIALSEISSTDMLLHPSLCLDLVKVS